MNLSLLPSVALAIGILCLTSYWILADVPKGRDLKFASLFFVLVSLVAQIVSESSNPIIFLHGGLVNDAFTQGLSLVLLTVVGLYLTFEFDETKPEPFFYILTLLLSYFALFAVQSNSLIFTWISYCGVAVSVFGLLNVESRVWATHKIYNNDFLNRLAMIIFFGTLILALCILAFGHTQLDEIHLKIIKVKISQEVLKHIQVLMFFLPVLIAGGIPLLDPFSQTRKFAKWNTLVFTTLVLSIISTQVAIKEGLFLFTRVAMGTKELEELSGVTPLFWMRILAAVGLLILPIYALASKNIRRSLEYILPLPVLLSFFAFSFGEKPMLSYAMGNIINILTVMALLSISYRSLTVERYMTLSEWRGVGRKYPLRAIGFLSAVWALIGYPPFFQSHVVQKIMNINSPMTAIVVVSYFLCGIYALRLSVTAFQTPESNPVDDGDLKNFEGIAAFCLFFLLIFMGIFWQPLYKYGAYTMRHLFGEF